MWCYAAHASGQGENNKPRYWGQKKVASLEAKKMVEGWRGFVATCCCFCYCWLVVGAVVAPVDCFPLGTIPLALTVAATAVANTAITAPVSGACCCFGHFFQLLLLFCLHWLIFPLLPQVNFFLCCHHG